MAARNPHLRLPIASITKPMTAVVALRSDGLRRLLSSSFNRLRPLAGRTTSRTGHDAVGHFP